MSIEICILGLIIAFVVYAFTYLNAVHSVLVNITNDIREALSAMEVCLRRKWDLIPNIIEFVKGYESLDSK